ncbi:ribosomal protein-like protein [Striga asiatica]|uniref:Ribosomal protein-like protein n=1 Tax=Striga asiatica TaxID=4170 RepID=A0A5A7PVG7_STRAF|nr:ribosomal protein-like protein [Striga asiatica]
MSQNSYGSESNSSSSTDSEDGDDTNDLEVKIISSIVQRSHELLQAYQHEIEVRRRRRFIQRNREVRHDKLQNIDAVGRQSLSPLKKCTTAIRQLAYGVPADHLDEYSSMFKDSSKCMKKITVFRLCLEALIRVWVLHTIWGYGMPFLVLQDHDMERAFGELQSRWAIVKVTHWHNDEDEEPAQPVQDSNREFQNYIRRS